MYYLLVKVIQSLLKSVCIILCFLSCVSPFLSEIRRRGRQGLTGNDSCDVFCNIERLVLSGVTSQGFACPTVDKKLFKVRLDLPQARRGTTTSLKPSPKRDSSRSKQVHLV